MHARRAKRRQVALEAKRYRHEHQRSSRAASAMLADVRQVFLTEDPVWSPGLIMVGDSTTPLPTAALVSAETRAYEGDVLAAGTYEQHQMQAAVDYVSEGMLHRMRALEMMALLGTGHSTVTDNGDGSYKHTLTPQA